jgi:hypothetical protein
MAMDTMSFRSLPTGSQFPDLTASNVCSMIDGFQMIRIHTQSVSAEVVQR